MEFENLKQKFIQVNSVYQSSSSDRTEKGFSEHLNVNSKGKI